MWYPCDPAPRGLRRRFWQPTRWTDSFTSARAYAIYPFTWTHTWSAFFMKNFMTLVVWVLGGYWTEAMERGLQARRVCHKGVPGPGRGYPTTTALLLLGAQRTRSRIVEQGGGRRAPEWGMCRQRSS
eukprot:353614-Chlamydomonas_euryale.AAC.6